MAAVTLLPNMKTQGGEVSDIMLNGRYVGSMTLVYREMDRISGSIQLERDSLQKQDKETVVTYMRDHVQSFVDAVQASSCEVLVTYSEYDHFIAANREDGTYIEEFDEEDFDYDWDEDDSRFDDIGDGQPDLLEMGRRSGAARRKSFQASGNTGNTGKTGTAGTKRGTASGSARYGFAIPGRSYDEPVVRRQPHGALPYSLVVVKEGRHRVDYHVHDREKEWVAEVTLRIRDADVSGDVNWLFDPTEEEIEAVSEMLVADYDEEAIDTFIFVHRFEGDIVETVEWTHHGLLSDDGENGSEVEREEIYTVVLARDDGDTLTYEIYNQAAGGLPIATATVDLSRPQLSGFIDFRQAEDELEMEEIATLLLRELDKEKEYDTVSLTMLYQNKPIDEIVFENEQLH